MSNPFEQIHVAPLEQQDQSEKNTAQSFLDNAGQSFAYTFVQSPLTGITQLAGHMTGNPDLHAVHLVDTPTPATPYTSDWVAQQVGGGAATVGQFLAAGFLMSKGKLLLGAGEAEGLVAKTTTLGLRGQMVMGATYGGLFTPVDEKSDFATQRIGNAVAGALQFGVMDGIGAGTRALGNAGVPLLSTLVKSDIATGAFSGLATGSATADINTFVHDGHGATGAERLQSAISFALIGGAFGAGSKLRFAADTRSGAADAPAGRGYPPRFRFDEGTNGGAIHLTAFDPGKAAELFGSPGQALRMGYDPSLIQIISHSSDGALSDNAGARTGKGRPGFGPDGVFNATLAAEVAGSPGAFLRSGGMELSTGKGDGQLGTGTGKQPPGRTTPIPGSDRGSAATSFSATDAARISGTPANFIRTGGVELPEATPTPGQQWDTPRNDLALGVGLGDTGTGGTSADKAPFNVNEASAISGSPAEFIRTGGLPQPKVEYVPGRQWDTPRNDMALGIGLGDPRGKAIAPADLENPTTLGKLLKEAADDQTRVGDKSDWAEYYGKYINYRLAAGGHPPIDTEAFARSLKAAGDAHHVYEENDLHGQRDEQWADWYAKKVIDLGLPAGGLEAQLASATHVQAIADAVNDPNRPIYLEAKSGSGSQDVLNDANKIAKAMRKPVVIQNLDGHAVQANGDGTLSLLSSYAGPGSGLVFSVRSADNGFVNLQDSGFTGSPDVVSEKSPRDVSSQALVIGVGSADGQSISLKHMQGQLSEARIRSGSEDYTLTRRLGTADQWVDSRNGAIRNLSIEASGDYRNIENTARIQVIDKNNPENNLLFTTEARSSEAAQSATEAATKRVRDAVSTTITQENDYWHRLLNTRTEENRVGSYWAMRPAELSQALKSANWTPYNPVDADGKALIQPEGVAHGFTADIPGGHLGMAPIDTLPPDAVLYLVDPKNSLNGGKGNWGLATYGGEGPATSRATMIIGPGDQPGSPEQVWTVHPGDPVRPSTMDNATLAQKLGIDLSQLPDSGPQRRIPVTLQQARELGFGLAKIEAPEAEGGH